MADDSHSAAARDRQLSRLHSLLGVVPLAGYACFHLWQQWPALHDREAWAARARSAQPGTVVGCVLLLLIALHAVLGVRQVLVKRVERVQRAQAGQEQGTRDSLLGFQLFTGVLLVGFLAYHVLSLWPVEVGPHTSVRDSYDALWTTLGRPLPLIIYVVGVSALAFHLATGLSRFANRVAPSVSVRALRYLAGVLGFLLWLAYLQIVARFAIGEGLIPTAKPVQQSAAGP